MCHSRSRAVVVGTVLLTLALGGSVQAGQDTYDLVARAILTTVKAFRSVYMNGVLEQVKRAGVEPKENWAKDDHGVMLPFEFIKAAGAEIPDFELGLIGLTPVYKANLPRTKAEADALKAMTANPKQSVITFVDGAQFKGLLVDLAINQACADCHNRHPASPRKDFKQGDVMGAIVVRITR